MCWLDVPFHCAVACTEARQCQRLAERQVAYANMRMYWCPWRFFRVDGSVQYPKVSPKPTQAGFESAFCPEATLSNLNLGSWQRLRIFEDRRLSKRRTGKLSQFSSPSSLELGAGVEVVDVEGCCSAGGGWFLRSVLAYRIRLGFADVPRSLDISFIALNLSQCWLESVIACMERKKKTVSRFCGLKLEGTNGV